MALLIKNGQKAGFWKSYGQKYKMFYP